MPFKAVLGDSTVVKSNQVKHRHVHSREEFNQVKQLLIQFKTKEVIRLLKNNENADARTRRLHLILEDFYKGELYLRVVRKVRSLETSNILTFLVDVRFTCTDIPLSMYVRFSALPNLKKIFHDAYEVLNEKSGSEKRENN